MDYRTSLPPVGLGPPRTGDGLPAVADNHLQRLGPSQPLEQFRRSGQWDP